MHEIFISYRRNDARTSAGRLHADLRRRFGDDCVFMDLQQGIAWGADYEKALDDALHGCEALVALIGPQWASGTLPSGLRRLEDTKDWVRREIATVLGRHRPVLPILLDGATAPAADVLPDELVELGFHRCQAYEISERHWDIDTDSLVEELAKIPRLRELHDLAVAATGIRLLEQLIRDNPDVADKVSRSRTVIETTDREVDEIRLLKNIHAALHEIESKCLKPLRQEPPAATLESARRGLRRYGEDIRKSIDDLASVVPPVPAFLDIDTRIRLDAADEAFDCAMQSRSADDRELAVGRLEELAGGIPARLNDAIDKAAVRMELEQLRLLVKAVVDLLPPAAAADSELRPLFESVDALKGLRDELQLRVSEHGLLQSLDNFLRGMVWGQRRAGTSGRIDSRMLEVNWSNVQRMRSHFKGPFSREVEEGHQYLTALEPGIEDSVRRGDEPDAMARFGEYANEVGELFLQVDDRLKDFCAALRDRTRPLTTILGMCRREVPHG